MALVKTLAWASEEEETIISHPRPRVVRPWSSIVVVVVGRRWSLSCPRRRRRRHQNGTAHWPSPGMTTSLCVIRVVRPRVALVVGRRGCCCADVPLVSAGGRSRKQPRTCAGWGGRTTNPARTLSAVVRTAWPIGQSQRRQRRQSSLSIGATAALLMGADAHVRVVSAGSGLDAVMYTPVLVVDTPPFSHLCRHPSCSLSLSSESCEPSSSSLLISKTK